MTLQKNQLRKIWLRRNRILFTWSVCLLLGSTGGFSGAPLQSQTAQQLQMQQQLQRQEQQREEQQREQQQREEQQREQQQREQQQQEQQREQQQQQEQQRQAQMRQQQEEQQRQQQQQQEQQRAEQQRQQQAEQQRQIQQQQEQQRAEQQHQQQAIQERQQEMQRQEQQRQQQQRSSRPDPVLQTRPVNPEPFRPQPERLPAAGVQPPIASRPPVELPRPIVPSNGREPVPSPRPEKPVAYPGRLVPEPGAHPVEPRLFASPEPIHPVRPIAPDHQPVLVKLPPPRPRPDRPEPVIVSRPPVVIEGRPVRVVAPSNSVAVILALPAPRRRVVVAGVVPANVVVAGSQRQYAAAETRLQQAQTGCAQADAYQNYVNQVVNNQNTTSAGVDQILQTLADNTSDPDVQNALENSIGQPNPINDALDQQLENQASNYESICQARLAAAQAAMPPDPSQQASAAQPAAPAADPTGDPNGQGGYQAALPDAADSGGQDPQGDTAQTGAAQSGGQQAGACPAVSLGGLPPTSGTWGPWAKLGDSGLVFDVSRVNATTLTWRFLNAGPNTIASMQFNYAFVNANTGQPATQSDVLPFALAPGKSVGGWTAYMANTRGNVTLTVTQISCQ